MVHLSAGVALTTTLPEMGPGVRFGGETILLIPRTRGANFVSLFCL